MVGIVSQSTNKPQLSVSETTHLVSQYFQVQSFGFLTLTSNEQFGQTWYPTPNDIVEAGWFALDVHNSAAGDFNGDGLQDIVLLPMLFQHVVSHQTTLNPIFLIQDTRGGFLSPNENLSLSAYPNKHFLYRAGIADFNGDGQDDLAASAMASVNRNAGDSQSIYESPLVVFGDGSTKFRWLDEFDEFAVQSLNSDSPTPGYTYGHSMAVGDFDGDGHLDWFSNHYAFYNNGQGGFRAELLVPNEMAETQEAPFTSQWFWPLVNSVTSADFNEDGFDDLVFSLMPTSASGPGSDGGDLWLMLGGPSGLNDGRSVEQLYRSNDITGNVGTNFMVSADFNGDGHSDLLFMEHRWTSDSGDSSQYYTGAKLRLFLGDGEGTLQESTTGIADPYAGHRHGEGNIHAVDVNGDGWIDVVLTGYPVNPTDTWLTSGEERDHSTIFLNRGGTLNYVSPDDLAYVEPFQIQGRESSKQWNLDGVSKLTPVDIGNDGMMDFVGFVQTPLTAWPQVEQQYTYAYISKAVAPLGRSEGDEVLTGTLGGDKIWGYAGDDVFYGLAGDDHLDGGNGIDKTIYSDARATYAIGRTETGFEVSHHTGIDGTDNLVGIERVDFQDVSVALDVNGNAGQVAKILGAVFGADSLANAEYVGIGLDLLDGGMSYTDLAALAVSVTGYSSSTDVCNLLWENVIGSPATSTDIAPFKAMLDSGQLGIGQLTTLAADTSFSTENIDLVGLSQTGLEYL